MKTVILDQPGALRFLHTDEPLLPGPGEALVHVRQVGVCGTDLHAYRGRQPFFSYPRILGHELGVEVLSVGEGVSGIAPGDRCSVEPYLNCGFCRACLAGRTNCCNQLQVLGVHIDGGLRERILLPANKLHRSDVLTFEQLALVETLGIGSHAVTRSGIEPGQTALIFGAGPIGLATAQFALLAGANVYVADVNEDRLRFCSERLGTKTLTSGEQLLDQFGGLTGSELAHVVFDATGSPACMNSSFNFVGFGGRLVFVSLVQAQIEFADPLFHRREMTLFATRNSTPADFHKIIGLMESGAIDTSPWITHRSSLEAMPGDFEDWLDPANHVVKAMVSTQ